MHTLTVGGTGSGKTTLWKHKARALIKANCPVLVVDPLGNDYPCHREATEAGDIVQYSRTINHAHIIVDESGSTIGRQPSTDLQWLTTQARNYGHSTHLICQRPQQVDRTMRLQCERLFVFRVGVADSKALAEEFTNEKAMLAATLDRFEFMEVDKYGSVRFYKVSPDGVYPIKR